MTDPARETLGFQTEVAELLHLMIHSLYGNKEIFLRELVSNASDAADKLRFEAMTDQALFENDVEPRIRVSVDAANRTITVSDNGIGMSRQEVVDVGAVGVRREAAAIGGQGRPRSRQAGRGICG